MVVVKFFGCDVALATIAGRRLDVATAGVHQRFPLAGISDKSPNFRGLRSSQECRRRASYDIDAPVLVTADP